MSMSMFFVSFKEEHIKEMLENESLVDEYIDEHVISSTDLGDTFGVVGVLFDDTTQILSIGKVCLECETMGATIKTPEEIKTVLENYDNLNLTDEQITEQILELDSEDIYRLNSLQEFPEEVVSELKELINFYRTALENNHGIVCYIG